MQPGDAARLRRRRDDVGAAAENERRQLDAGEVGRQVEAEERADGSLAVLPLARGDHLAGQLDVTGLRVAPEAEPGEEEAEVALGHELPADGPPPGHALEQPSQPARRTGSVLASVDMSTMPAARAPPPARGSAPRTPGRRCRPSSARRARRRAGPAARARVRTSSARLSMRVPARPGGRLAVAAVVERDAAETLLGELLELLHPHARRERHAVGEEDRRALAAADRVDARRRRGSRKRHALVERRDERLARVAVGSPPHAGDDRPLDGVGGAREPGDGAGGEAHAARRASGRLSTRRPRDRPRS